MILFWFSIKHTDTKNIYILLDHACILVIQHLLRRQLLRWWYLGQQRLRVRVMIGFLVWGRVKIKIGFRVRVRVGVMFNINIYHRSNYRRSKCRTFVHTTVEPHYNKDLGIMKLPSCCIRFKPLIFRVRPLRPLGHILSVHHQWEDLERAPKYLRPNGDYYITVKKNTNKWAETSKITL